MTTQSILLQIIRWSISEEMDPARAVQDYLAEKDSHITLVEARRLVARQLEQESNDGQLV